ARARQGGRRSGSGRGPRARLPPRPRARHARFEGLRGRGVHARGPGLRPRRPRPRPRRGPRPGPCRRRERARRARPRASSTSARGLRRRRARRGDPRAPGDRRVARRPAMSRRFRLTREGRVFLGATLLVGVAAINTGNNLLYLVLSLLLGLLLLSGVLSDLSLLGLRAQVSLPSRLEVGREAYAEVHVTNGKRRLRSFSIVASPLSGETALGEALFLKLEPGERASAVVRFSPGRRGELVVGSVELRTQYPFALVDKRRRVRVSERVIVHPRSAAHGAPTP